MSKDVSGFICIIGRPNVGKSTFLNAVLGKKVAIMSDKPQTTRNTILGIYTTEHTQIVFTDTPGIHKPHHELGRRMVNAAYESTKGVDAIIFMIPADQDLGPGDLMIMENLKNTKTPIYLVINKIDLVKSRIDIDKLILKYQEHLNFAGVFPISALDKTNVDKLILELESTLPEGPKYYPEDMITDHPERFICAELIREKVLFATKEEVPHSVAVVIESLKQSEDNPNYIDIYATIYVERDSQKKIIIGKNGDLIKDVKLKSIRDIKFLLGSKVHLELWVKVKKDWTDHPQSLSALGYSNDNF